MTESGFSTPTGQLNDRFAAPAEDPDRLGQVPAGLQALEEAASALVTDPGSDSAAKREAFRRAQRDLWVGLRLQGNPWVISDLITFGSPMYFADRLYTRNRAEFDLRSERWELPMCPPLSEGGEDSKPYNNIYQTERWYTFKHKQTGHRTLYHGAPFAVVRWTNMWFPRKGIGGDWFGGPLAPLYGRGITDIPLWGNRPDSRWPGVPHSFYFKFGDDISPESVTTQLRKAMELNSTSWLDAVREAKPPSQALPAE